MFYIVWISSHLDYREFEHYPFNPEFIHSILSGAMGANTRSISILGPVTVVLSLAVDAVAFQFFNSTPSGIPSTCGDILMRNITCDELFQSLLSRVSYTLRIEPSKQFVCQTAKTYSMGIAQPWKISVEPQYMISRASTKLSEASWTLWHELSMFLA